MRSQTDNEPLVTRIDALLPQTQCRQCTYQGCRPYAEAIARGEADINQCPPGGQSTIDALAGLLGCEAKPLNPAHGEETERMVAVIDENRCIGCVLCIKACPVDAILGASKQMHTVIAEECTGCKLCIAPCPVDCISMQPIIQTEEMKGGEYARRKSDHYRRRFEARNVRLEREQQEKAARVRERQQQLKDSKTAALKMEIKAAVERVKAKKAAALKKVKPN